MAIDEFQTPFKLASEPPMKTFNVIGSLGSPVPAEGSAAPLDAAASLDDGAALEAGADDEALFDPLLPEHAVIARRDKLATIASKLVFFFIPDIE
ncbi:hypothetical protein [Cohnella rhizosphaerae]|uniref:Uncharacterized protein n=1 Tax=Cohnella rhizosphaerae TaxID=1457232 RepID=A0A9X4KX09_9BACL|nr:hypothetical protein [Cohnella rhizosphaerae]MDG0812745.1 hypothetical protein [Cohnella rhizosphaerae]